MTAQNKNQYRWWTLGLALTLPVMILCGGLAGYFLSVLLVQQLKAPAVIKPALCAFGVLITAYHASTLVKRFRTTLLKDESKK